MVGITVGVIGALHADRKIATKSKIIFRIVPSKHRTRTNADDFEKIKIRVCPRLSASDAGFTFRFAPSP
jgi:hypothetical protein